MICIIWLTLLSTFVAMSACMATLPVIAPATLQESSVPLGSVIPEDLLRQFNVSLEDVEAATNMAKSRGKNHATHTPFYRSTVSPETNRQLQRQKSTVKSDSAAKIRKDEILRQVLVYVRENGRPQNPTPTSSTPNVEQQTAPFQANSPVGVNVGRIRYFQPSCAIPKHTDEELWNGHESLHLYFNVSGIQPREGSQLCLSSAKLRLFKYAEGTVQENGSQDAPQNKDQIGEPLPFFDPAADEHKIRVSVHNYTRSLKRHRPHKKKLLDSLMAGTKEQRYKEFDVTLAVRWWLVPSGRNYGLVVEVEDTQGKCKASNRFFKSRNCSSIDESMKSDEISDPSNLTVPILELILFEVPDCRGLVKWNVPMALAPSVVEVKKPHEDEVEDEDALAADEEPRKHRHQNHCHTEEQADDAGNSGAQQAHTVKPAAVANHYNRQRSGSNRPQQRHTTLATSEDADSLSIESDNASASSSDKTEASYPQYVFLQRMMHAQRKAQQHLTRDSKRTTS